MILNKIEISLLQAVFVVGNWSCFLCILCSLLNQTALDGRHVEILGTCSFIECYLLYMHVVGLYI